MRVCYGACSGNLSFTKFYQIFLLKISENADY